MPDYSIAYPATKRGAALAARAAGFDLWRNSEGAWRVTAPDLATAQACQDLLDGYDDLARERAAAKRRVKDEAQRRIFELLPMWRQMNLLMGAVRVLYKEARGLPKTNADAVVEARALEMDQRISAIRAASDLIEAQVDQMTDTASLETLDVAGNSRWPPP